MVGSGPSRRRQSTRKMFLVDLASHESSGTHLGPIFDHFPGEDTSYAGSGLLIEKRLHTCLDVLRPGYIPVCGFCSGSCADALRAVGSFGSCAVGWIGLRGPPRCCRRPSRASCGTGSRSVGDEGDAVESDAPMAVMSFFSCVN